MIHNTARPRWTAAQLLGNETGALEKATQVFWSKGYDGVTIDDLVAGMEVWDGRACTCRLWGQAGHIPCASLRRTCARAL